MQRHTTTVCSSNRYLGHPGLGMAKSFKPVREKGAVGNISSQLSYPPSPLQRRHVTQSDPNRGFPRDGFTD